METSSGTLACYAQMVPPEVLAQIFILFSESQENRWVGRRAAPLILMQICHYWRQAALSTPRVWRRLSAYVRNAGAFESKAAFMRLWLSRSGSGPLDISLAETCCYAWASTSPTMAVISDYLHRCRSLELRVPESRIQWFTPPQAPILSRLTVIYGPRTHRDYGKDLGLAFSPHIRILDLDLDYLRRLHSGSVQWAGLHTLSVSGVLSAYEILAVLHECSSLRHCDLAFYGSDNEEEAEYQETVKMDHLERLSLHYNDDSVVDMVVEKLDTPGLTSLAIYADECCEGFLATWRSVLPEAGSMLKDLFIKCDGGILPDSDIFSDFLRQLEHLEDLTIICSRLGDPFNGDVEGFLQALTLSTDDTPSSTLLPRLRKLELTGVSQIITMRKPSLDTCVQEFCSSRPLSSGLQSVSVKWCVPGDAHVTCWSREDSRQIEVGYEDPVVLMAECGDS
ncbi:hypothetical protein OE88DRAFT_1643167 [Heliocybe sulcata]|uniref:Uncharacterized protein n=1 Tax=Heliocybe sulcata TaxID=5364 RepID=A0A5C3N8H5_9AGAM|nr:hypothetical protein OE88DRAFT_1643167 [Heliocybe sulcata]